MVIIYCKSYTSDEHANSTVLTDSRPHVMHLTVFSEQLQMLTYTQRMHQPDDRQAGINDWQ